MLSHYDPLFNACNLCDLFNNIACNECVGTQTFNSSGQNTALTTVYVLINDLGFIQAVSNILHPYKNLLESNLFIQS